MSESSLLCECQTEGWCQAHGPQSEQIWKAAKRIAAAHNRGWARCFTGGYAVYGPRLEGDVGGAWYSDNTVLPTGVVRLRVGEEYTVDEVVDKLVDMLDGAHRD